MSFPSRIFDNFGRLTSPHLAYIIRYILFSGRTLMQTAKIFQNGRSQAIRLPKEFRVNARAVYLKKTPEGFWVIRRDPWEVFFEAIEEWSDEFMSAGRQQWQVNGRKWKSGSVSSSR